MNRKKTINVDGKKREVKNLSVELIRGRWWILDKDIYIWRLSKEVSAITFA